MIDMKDRSFLLAQRDAARRAQMRARDCDVAALYCELSRYYSRQLAAITQPEPDMAAAEAVEAGAIAALWSTPMQDAVAAEDHGRYAQAA
jgi:hypothetical protein